MTTLTAFLLARITEDEEDLDVPDFVEVDSARGPGWGSRGDCPVCDAPQWDGSEAVTEEAWWEHAERTHQRSRVLAECEAKRRIVELASQIGDDGTYRAGYMGAPRAHGPIYPGHPSYQQTVVLDTALRALAQVYADHPDYAPSWAISE